MIARLGLATFMLLMSACAQTRPAPTPGSPLIDPPLPPSSLGSSLTRSEVVTGEYNGQTHSIRVETEISADKLVVVGVSHAGIPLFTIEQQAEALEVWSQTGTPQPFSPAYVLTDLQLVHWPADVLNTTLAGKGYALIVDEHDDSRLVIDGNGNPVVRIFYDANDPSLHETLVEHLDIPYRLHIEMISDNTDG